MFKDKAKKIFYNKIISEHELIKVKPGKCRYNYRCQMNAVHEASRKKDSKLAMVVYMDGKEVDPIIHFINYRKGRFIDNTLGEWSSLHDYYIIKFIDESEFRDINHIFTRYRENIKNNMPWYVRMFNNYIF